MKKKNMALLSRQKDVGKDLDKFEQTRPTQLEMFAPEDLPGEYSSVLRFYDAIPKYVTNRKSIKEIADIPIVEHQFEFEGVDYHVSIVPAIVKGADGKSKVCFAGEREEIIEDGLRKLAMNGNSRFLDGEIGVIFTLYQLQKELKRMGHTYSIAQIKESIQIGNRSTMDVTKIDGAKVIASHYFPQVRMATRADIKKNGKAGQEAYVTFHPLVTAGINRGEYRQLNYNTLMGFKYPLTRWFYKRLCSRYRQANMHEPYHIDHERVMTESGIGRRKELRNEVLTVERSLQELKDCGVIFEHDTVRKCEGRRKNKITGAVYHLNATKAFGKEVTRANALQRSVMEELRSIAQGATPTKRPQLGYPKMIERG